MAYVVVCDNPEDEPGVFGPFDSPEQAQVFVDEVTPEPCPNDHFISRLYRVNTKDS